MRLGECVTEAISKVPRTGAQIVIDTLNSNNVEHVFAHTGGAIIELHRLLNTRRMGSLKIPEIVMAVHEQGAGHMAEGYARRSNKVGVVLVTSGPGATNIITPLASAYKDSIPIVFITGQASSSQIGTDAFQEIDTAGITRSICKHNFLVRNIEELERSLVLAFQIAKSGKPGPVVVDICSDVFTRTTNLSVTLATNASLFRNPRMSAKKAMEIIATLQQAKRPVVLAGGGVNNTEASVLLRTFVDKFKLPTTLTFMGLGALAFNHPLFLGMPGMHGTRAANIALTEADCILIIGARLDNRVALNGFADGKTIIHVDIASEEIHKIIVAQLGLVTSASEFLAFANSVVARDRDGADEWIRHTSDLKTQHAQQDSFISSSHPFVDPDLAIATLAQESNNKLTIVTDVGQHQMHATRFGYRSPRQWISSGGLAPMGFGLPAAIGAMFADRDQKVVLVCGDGGFLMTIQELKVISDHALPVKIVLFNNGHLGMVRQWEDLTRHTDNNATLQRGVHHETCTIRNVDCDPNCMLEVDECTKRDMSPDFVKLVESFHGIATIRVTKNSQLSTAIRIMLDHPGAFFLELLINRTADVTPMVRPGGNLADFIEFRTNS